MKNKIVRKLDELGRVIIPAEMRALLNLREGDNIEISVANEYIQLRKEITDKNDEQ